MSAALTPTTSKPGPSFVRSVCSRDMVRVMTGHSAGFFTRRVLHWQQIWQLVHVEYSLQQLTLAQTSMQHNLHVRAIQNLHQHLLHFRMFWLLQLDFHKRQRSQSSNRFAFSTSELYTPSHTFPSSTTTPNQTQWQLFLVCRLQCLHMGFFRLIVSSSQLSPCFLRTRRWCSIFVLEATLPLSRPLSEPLPGFETSLLRWLSVAHHGPKFPFVCCLSTDIGNSCA